MRRASPGRSSQRILLITHAVDLGGAELALLRLVDALPARPRSLLTVACLAEGELPRALRDRGIDVRIVPLADRTRSLTRRDVLAPHHLARAALDTLAVVGALRRAARDAGLVQSASMKAHLLSVPVALTSGRPLVWYLHDRVADDYLPAPVVALLRLLSRVPRRVIVNSRATARTVPREALVIYPGFAPGQALDEASSRRRQPPERPTFTMLGRISPTKGQREFVAAAAIVEREHPGCRFRVVGSPMFGQESYARDVRRQAAGLGACLDWVGFAADPAAELDAATALVHASPIPEPFGQVVLEACVRGVPVIATDAGGVPEILGEEGVLVEPGDPEALAAAMLSCLRDPAGTKERALRAYERAVRMFPIATSAQQMVEVWSAIVGPLQALPVLQRPARPPVATGPVEAC